TARRVHPPGAGEAPGLHRRLGASEAERPGAAHRAVQGPVPLGRRTRGKANRRHVSATGPRGDPVGMTIGRTGRGRAGARGRGGGGGGGGGGWDGAPGYGTDSREGACPVSM